MPNNNRGKWLKAVSTEKVPGSDKNSVQRVNGIKEDARVGIERTLSRDQYSDYASWNLDTNRVNGVPTSPWDDFNRAVDQRVEELGK